MRPNTIDVEQPREKPAIPERPSRVAAAERAREHHWRSMALVGIIAIAIAGYVAASAGTDAAVIDPDSPEVLAFAEQGHEGHDHGQLRVVAHGGDDFELAELGGPVPDVIKENMLLPVGAEVVHVIVAEDGVWQFEGNLADGSQFWKIVDLNRGLIFNAGEATSAVPFP